MFRMRNVSRTVSLSLVIGVVLAACAPAAPAVDTAATEEAMHMAETEAVEAGEMHMAETEAVEAEEMHMAETEAAEEATVEVLPSVTVEAMVEYTVELGGTDALGEFLVVGTGMAKGLTLYTFANDTEGMSTCTGNCATTWPPLLVEEGEPTASMDVTGSLGVYERMEDGGRQLTYNGMPLYYFSGDSKPGDTNGQGLGNVWFVAAP